MLAPELTPDSTRSGGPGMTLRTPMMTQSVGVPRTAKWRSPIFRKRSGSDSDSEWAKPDWSVSGATTQTSSDSWRAMRSSDGQALGVDAVVIGEKYAHAHFVSSFSSPPL